MSSTVIPPSPNWFLSECLQASSDGWLVYGTLGNDIAVTTLASDDPLTFTRVRLARPAHRDRVTCVALSPEWTSTREFVSGADDGYVKLWNAEALIPGVAHDVHSSKKEGVVAVVFLDENRVLSIGSSGSLVTWNIRSNTVRRECNTLKFFKPVCAAVCPGKKDVVAVGTKQGVAVVLSVTDKISILYKAPGHRAEITSLSWCPDPDIELSVGRVTDGSESSVPEPTVPPREEKNQDNGPSENKTLKREENLNEATGEIDSDFLRDCRETLKLIKSRGSETSDSFSFTDRVSTFNAKKTNKSEDLIKMEESTSSFALKNESKNYGDDTERADLSVLDDGYESPIADESVSLVADDSDIFDMYKDRDEEEFGHQKPEKFDDSIPTDSVFCALEKLTIRNDVHAIERDEADCKNKDVKNDSSLSKAESMNSDTSKSVKSFSFGNKDDVKTDKEKNYYLASCCKNGLVCIWKWGGALIVSRSLDKTIKKKLTRKVTHPFGAICWLKSMELIATTKESQLISMKLANDGKITFKNIHNEHKRGLFRITSGVNEDSQSILWTVSMDRLLVGHSIMDNRTNVYSTFGGFVYDIQISPIDPTTFAVGAGDGTIRIWKLLQDKNERVKLKFIKQFWNGISGKVLSVAWHPTKEKCLAFTTYEGRIGLLDISTENPAKLFSFSLPLGAFRVCWNSSNNLFACGVDSLVVYDSTHPNKEPEKIVVNVCNEKWSISTMLWTEEYLCVGSSNGGFALLNPSHPYNLIHATYPHKKRISCIAWHPLATTSDDEVSPYSDLIAVGANSKNLVILKLNRLNDQCNSEIFLDMEISADNIINISWNPHNGGKLLITSKDCSVQVWDVINKCRLHTFTDHEDPVLSAIWHPLLSKYVMSCGSDNTLRIWNMENYGSQEVSVKRKHKKKTALAKIREFDDNLATLQMEKEEMQKNESETVTESCEISELATISKSNRKSQKKNYPLVNFRKKYKNEDGVVGCRKLFEKIKAEQSNVSDYVVDYSDNLEYLKIYGGHEDIMQILESEKNSHMETFNWNALTAVGAIAGNLKEVIEFASKHRKLNPHLLSLAPSISHRFWKDTLISYNTQIEGEDSKKNQDSIITISGDIWRSILFLSLSNIEEACMTLSACGMEPEAICVARARHADHIAEKHMKMWSETLIKSLNYVKAAECLLSLGMIMEAANILSKSNEESELAFAAEMAKYAGNPVLANSISSNR